jgi:hypothetical protein
MGRVGELQTTAALLAGLNQETLTIVWCRPAGGLSTYHVPGWSGFIADPKI